MPLHTLSIAAISLTYSIAGNFRFESGFKHNLEIKCLATGVQRTISSGNNRNIEPFAVERKVKL